MRDDLIEMIQFTNKGNSFAFILDDIIKNNA
jgi:hypothetical protein